MPKTESEKTSNKKRASSAKSDKSDRKGKSMRTKEPASADRSSVSSSSSRAATEAAPLSPEERYRMVQDAAYHIAEKDGFQHGREQDYWFQAEKEIDARLSSGGTESRPDIH